MLSLNNLYVQYGDRILLNGISLSVKPGERIGLVGRNGAGKSTLLKIIAGEMSPHEGQVIKPARFTIGYLHQDMLLPKGKTVLEEAMTAFSEVLTLEEELRGLQNALVQRCDYETEEYHRLLGQIGDITERLHQLGQQTTTAHAERVLTGLGFRHTDMNRLTDELSGGWQMRVELAKILLRQPDLILLDEPTNHLDIESILWLEEWLNRYPGMLIVISHDRRFLDNVTNRTIEIVLGRIEDYKVPYSQYVQLSAERRQRLQAAYENQQRFIAERERTIARFIAKATKSRAAQSMQKQLDRIERIEIEEQDVAVMRVRFPEAPRSGEIVAKAENLSKRYGDLRVLENIDFQIVRGERVAFVGQNGQGKTTLAKILIGQESPTSGKVSLGYNVSIGYYAQNQAETLNPQLTVLETMELNSPPEMRPRLRTILGAFLFSGDDVNKKVVALSGGERARLALACMLLRPFNFLVLDEPTNHLDMLSKDVLKQALLEYNGTLLVVSHDREFLSGLTNRTLEFRNGQLREYLGDVNYFLEKRQLDNMRQVELRTPQHSGTPEHSATPKRSNQAASARSSEDKKQLQRQLQRAEKRITEIEAELKKMEALMEQPDFYTRSDYQQILERYYAARKELEHYYTEWETAVEQLS
ncbi:MAG: ABC-F family ATP-binding cassette domain-containing protein [Saprospiraceae bacterium]|nr:ABC-F family ATP-binding cassette domain-containing protein [Saprospiraceae bacterium]MDW8483116.1 ABC-F family ATP-binding cassette domain-containing protein [Saprospiraceae bacterium]